MAPKQVADDFVMTGYAGDSGCERGWDQDCGGSGFEYSNEMTITLEDFRKITLENRWSAHAQWLLFNKIPPRVAKERFGTYWIEGGHHIRKQIANDVVLVCLLRHMLPVYLGGTVKLFRGENQERWESQKVGLAWTVDIDVAKMFGRGLNSSPLGGVLLEGTFDSKAIISGPNSHSMHLGEHQFTIDPFHVTKIVVIEKFPPCF